MGKNVTGVSHGLGRLFCGFAAAALLTSLVACSPDPGEMLASAKKSISEKDYPTAIVQLKTLLQETPDNPEARLLLAQTAFAMADTLSAEKELSRALELGADFDQNRLLHYRIQLAMGKGASVLEMLATDTGKNGLTVEEALEVRAMALLGLGSLSEAEATWREAILLSPNSPVSRWGLAASLAAQGRADEATDDLAQLVIDSPGYSRAWMLKGQLSLRAGELNEAASAFSNGIDAAMAEPDRMQALLGLGGLADAQLGLGELEAADVTIDQLRRLAGESSVVRFLLARLAFARKDYIVAAGELEKNLLGNPNDLRSMFLMGAVNLAQGNYRQAEMGLSHLVSLSPENMAARRLLASAQMKLARPGAAVETLEPLIDGDDTDLGSSLLISETLLRAGETNRAIELLEKNLAKDPENVQLKLSLAAGYQAGGRSRDAIAVLEGVPQQEGNYRRELLLALAYSSANESSEAREQIENILKNYPDDVTALTLGADYYNSRGDNERAREYLEKAIKLDPSAVSARMALARLTLARGDVDGALAQYGEVARINPSYVPALLVLANINAQRGQLDEVSVYLQRAIDADKENAGPRLMLAKLYMRQGKTSLAEQAAREAVALGQKNPDYLAAAAEIFLGGGKAREALGLFRQALDLGPENARYWLGLAKAQLALNERVDGRKSLESSIRLNPNSVEANSALALLEAREGYTERALEIARKLQARNPEFAGAYILEGDILMQVKRYSDATPVFERALEYGASGPLAIRAYQAATQAGQDNSDRFLVSWLADHPDDGAVVTVFAQSAHARGDNALAIKYYQRAVELNEKNVAALNNLAWMYHEQGNPEAEPLARRANALQPGASQVSDTLGWILVESGKSKEGLPLLESAYSKAPANMTVAYHLAVAKFRTGDVQGSKQLLSKILSSDNVFEERENAKTLLSEIEAK